MYNIDLTITAVMRPSIFETTINSFFKNLFDNYLEQGNGLRLVLNIDPIGEGNNKGFIKCLEDRFNISLINMPTQANFPKAFKYVWSNVRKDADYVFHLEDDWELLQHINLVDLINIMEKEKDLGILRLSAFYAMGTKMKCWNKWFPYNSRYYECPEELKASVGFCGHPSLIRGKFVRNTVDYLDENRNPEKQFHSKGQTPIMKEVMKWRYGVYSIPGANALIRDIGRQWMIENNFRKKGCKAHFINWEKVG